jgi:riboflavin kinase/FMN adenylyltransferase
VASLGWRPTFDGRDLRLEVHVFDLDADLYGRWLCCDFVERLRDEEKFESIEALQAQMAQDCIRARTVLAAGPG